MRAKFGRGPTVVSKKGSFKFISRYRPTPNLLYLGQERSEKNDVCVKKVTFFFRSNTNLICQYCMYGSM